MLSVNNRAVSQVAWVKAGDTKAERKTNKATLKGMLNGFKNLSKDKKGSTFAT
jgi:hypothetical protein